MQVELVERNCGVLVEPTAERSLLVRYVEPSAMPLHTLSALAFPRECKRLHTLTVEALFLNEVDNVERHDSLGEVAHAEVEPLSVGCRVHVVGKIQVVLRLADPHDLVQVAAFKLGVEDQVLRIELPQHYGRSRRTKRRPLSVVA